MIERRLLTTARVSFLVCALTCLASSSVRMIVPTEGLTATGVTATGCLSGEYWKCVNDPVGSPNGDTSYVANPTPGTTGSHRVTFNGTVTPAVGTNIRGVTMHVVAKTTGSGQVQMTFFNNGVQAGQGGKKTLTGSYVDYASVFPSTMIDNLDQLSMQVDLINTTGEARYTQAWIELTYDGASTPQTLSGLEHCLVKYQDPDGSQHSPDQDKPCAAPYTQYSGGSCTSHSCAGGNNQITNTVTPDNPNSPCRDAGTGCTDTVSTKIDIAPTSGASGVSSALEWVKKGVDTSTDNSHDLKGEWWFYETASNGNSPRSLEFDLVWGAGGSDNAMWGTHCYFPTTSYPQGKWELDAQDTSPGQWSTPIDAVTGQAIPCNLSSGTWHHIVWEVHRDDSAPTGAKVVYDRLTIDNVAHVLKPGSNTFGYKYSGGWHIFASQVQQDMNAPQPFTEWVDAMTLTYW